MPPADERTLRVASVFTGAAGLDLGLHATGAETVSMCESWEPARRVLAAKFPDLHVSPGVENYLPETDYDVLTAGFPCTDLSHAGGKAGIFGAQSGLVEHVYRIAEQTHPEWIVLENVPNLLHLHRGLGIKTVTSRLEQLGYRWAYRTLDSRFTGIPQRRNRVFLLASRVHDPAPNLLGQDSGLTTDDFASKDPAWGFYWTEGRNGLGLIQGAVPTLKGGSTIGLPSAPAVWVPNAPVGNKFVIPSIAAGEQLQGFEPGWTSDATRVGERDLRWKLVGNAVTTRVGEWIGRRLSNRFSGESVPRGSTVHEGDRWPDAAWGAPGHPPQAAPVSRWPEMMDPISLAAMVDDEWKPLSYRATRGFLDRVDQAGRTLDKSFGIDLEEHLQVARRSSSRHGAPQDLIRESLAEGGFECRLDVHAEFDVAHRLALVHPKTKVAVDLRSCFWHGCPDHVDRDLASNERWLAKRRRVVSRDAKTVEQLTDRGWFIVVGWAHDRPAKISRRALAVMRDRHENPMRISGGADEHHVALPMCKPCIHPGTTRSVRAMPASTT